MNAIKQLVRILKPWAGALLVIAILQFTGLLSSISYFAQSTLLKTGIMNPSATPLKEGDDFNYNFKIKDLNGNQIDFAQFKEKVVFLNLWATWCGPCRAEMPTIQKLYDKMDDDPNVIFVMLSIDKDKDKDKVARYLTDKQYTFSGYMPSGYLTDQLDVPEIPTTFVISKSGKIIAKEIGTTNFNSNRFYKFLKSEASK